jgi:transposase InsO family protein
MGTAMEFFSPRHSIGSLEGKSNWSTWKYKILIMLRGTADAMDVLEGRLNRPEGNQGAGDAAVLLVYNQALARYTKANCSALLILTTNMTDETLQKVMRFETAYEVWKELHRLFDGQTEDRSYHLCMEFFNFKRNPSDDVSSHMSKLKNIWNNLNVAISMADYGTGQLPDLLLICKILETLDERFFAFKSSWLLLNKTERTVDNLTTQLCCYEKALENREGTTSQEILAIPEVQESKKKKDAKLKCNYCSQMGHRVRNCKKWIKDGRPPKPSSSAPASKHVQSITLMAVHACSKTADQDGESWFVDNGATTHITTRRDAFQEFEPFDSDDQTVKTADGTMIPALGKGIVMVESMVGKKTETIRLKDVWLVPSLTKNLFSTLSAQDNSRNSLFTSTATSCQLDIDGETKIVGKRELKGGLYKLQFKTVPSSKMSNTIEVNALTGTNMLQVYHERYAHQDKRHVKAVVKREFGITLPDDNVKCEACIFGKAHRLPFGRRERATTPGELIHSDVCGPFEHPSVQKYKYFVLFKDDFSLYRLVYFMRHKSEVKDKLKLMLNETKIAGHTVKCLLSDNGGEFDNGDVRKILNTNGIQQRFTMPYTPEQNGCSERENRTLVEAARTWLHSRGELPQKLWAELINTAAYVLNRTGPTRVKDKVPYELWFGKKPKICHLRVIGSLCYAHVPKQCRKKLSKKAIKGVLIGYENNDGYRIWDGMKTNRSRDITFASEVEFKVSIRTDNNYQIPERALDREGVRNDGNSDNIPEQEHINAENHDHVLEGDRHSIREDQDQEGETHEHDSYDEGATIHTPGFESRESSNNDDNEEFADADSDQGQLEILEPLLEPMVLGEPVVEGEPRYNLRDRSAIKRPKKFDDHVCFVGTERFPETYNEALSREDKAEWQKAMANELKSLEENQVWTLCGLPPNRKALPCKWVFTIKRQPDGTVDKYKARLVAKGFKQQKGIDYEQTFSPVARMATIRALLSVSAKEKLHLMQFDVSTAFLNGKIEEEIYMKQPDGFNDGTSKVCLLRRSLYGLKQAPRCWNSCFEEILLAKGFVQSTADSCLYTKNVMNKKILITLYVDDGLVASTDETLAHQFLEELGRTVKITTKPASYYLGMEIQRAKDGSVCIKQEAYTRKILNRFGMSECNPVSTPIEKNSTTESGKVVIGHTAKKFPYREAVGALTYLMTGTRPDIAYAVGVVSRKLENPTEDDWLRVKRVFRYLKGTISYGIRYNANCTRAIIEGYSDADHAGDDLTGRSTTGVTCLFAEGVVSWLSQRQPSVAISTTEAEIVAASEGARELVWLQRIFCQLTSLEGIPTLKVDNEAAIRLANNPEFHKRTKHIRVRHFFVRETVQEGLVDIQKTSSAEQLADLLTKAVPKPRLVKLTADLGLQNFSC